MYGRSRGIELVGKIIQDLDTESLIRKHLNAGVMVKRKYGKTEVGTGLMSIL